MSTQINNTQITLETKNNVVLSCEPVSIIVDMRDWNRLKRAVNKYKSTNDWWLNFGFAFLGFAGSALLQLLVYQVMHLSLKQNWYCGWLEFFV